MFFGSAPSTRANNRGLMLSQINLGRSQPPGKIHVYGEALDTLCSTLSCLYSGYDKHWLGTRPTARKMMEEKAARIDNDEANELIRARKGDAKGAHF